MKIALLLAFAGMAAFGAATNYEIDTAHTAAQFKIRHMMISNVRGQFTKTTGKLVFDPSNLAASSVEATIDTNTISTREPKRDAHLRSADFFDVAKYPAITFKSTKFEAAGANKYKVTGDLSMHGVTKSVVLDLSDVVKQGETRLGGQASTTLSRKEFGLTWNRAIETGGVAVGDEVEITIDLELLKR